MCELRGGLRIDTRACVGTLALSGVRVAIRPKMGFRRVLQLIGRAYDLSDRVLVAPASGYGLAGEGLADLLGLALLRETERIARGGLVPDYREREARVASPRGRIDFLDAALTRGRVVVRCRFDDLTYDHRLHRVLSAGLRLASRVVEGGQLACALALTRRRIFEGLVDDRGALAGLDEALRTLDRRGSRYRMALELVRVLRDGQRTPDAGGGDDVALASFLVDMNRVFERFLERHLASVAPPGTVVRFQDRSTTAWAYRANPHRWGVPAIRPDLVFRRGGRVFAVGDAKYRDHVDRPPTTSELYQLTTYGLVQEMAPPGEVLLFHPLVAGADDRPACLVFAPPGFPRPVTIRVVGVPVDRILDGSEEGWWPWSSE